MADSKKYNGSTWQHSLRKLGTSTDTLTTLPADIYADGNNATVGLVGNMQQTDTPTPTTPIQPQETGERTGNLFDMSATDTTNGYVANSYLDNTGNIASSNYYNISEYIDISGINAITVSGMKPSGTSGSSTGIAIYASDKTLIPSTEYNYGSVTEKSFSIPSNAKYIRISYNKNLSNITMLNSGSTALPYEPYGYKIPILSGGTTTPIYLGEVETTRKIKKLVLDGTEDWGMTSGNKMNLTLTDIPSVGVSPICTHYQGIPATSYSSVNNNEITVSIVQSENSKLALYDNRFTSKSDFQAYLAQQYSVGTPVTVWYVLATETTGIVNEPIRKIGDYADTVSGITIPTITGKDTFDVLTTLKPSEVSLAYTGWHDATVKEWDGSEWQDEQPVSLLSASSRPTLTESTPDIMDITEPEEEKE